MPLMDHIATNGTHRPGRTVSPLPEHTFKDSGITITIRKVGPTTQQRLAQQIMKDYPEPQPPIIETELGPEPNPADPAYLSAKEAWSQQTRTELSDRLMLIAALEAEVTIDDAARADIARKKRHLKLIGIPYEDNPDLTAEEKRKGLLHLARRRRHAGRPGRVQRGGAQAIRADRGGRPVTDRHVSTRRLRAAMCSPITRSRGRVFAIASCWNGSWPRAGRASAGLTISTSSTAKTWRSLLRRTAPICRSKRS
jgi:hypothetical protein